MKIGFDIISDLNLKSGDTFDWTGKNTSLYCIVAGNISSDLGLISLVLNKLSHLYQGIFYIGGSLEYEGATDAHKRAMEINKLCRKFRNVAFLHHNVVIIDGIAILGANGWSGNVKTDDIVEIAKHEFNKYEDIAYLKTSLEKLQKHIDVRKIILVTNSVPNTELYFGEVPDSILDDLSISLCLESDLEKKVSHWVFGTHKKIVDTVLNNINYINNPFYKESPYWAKRIEIEI